jgi:hypothetical protein
MGKHRHHKHKDHHECHEGRRCGQWGPDFCAGPRFDETRRFFNDWNGWAPDYGIPGYVYPNPIFAYKNGAAWLNGMIIGRRRFCCEH